LTTANRQFSYNERKSKDPGLCKMKTRLKKAIQVKTSDGMLKGEESPEVGRVILFNNVSEFGVNWDNEIMKA
jgi:hypothetical protein